MSDRPSDRTAAEHPALLPCPMCGSAPYVMAEKWDGDRLVSCPDANCLLSTLDFKSAQWNTRAHPRQDQWIPCSECGGDKELPADVLKMCAKRGWSLHWTHRGSYLHLESSELIEAIRGKHGAPLQEAADVLLVLMSITEYAGIPWSSVVRQARSKNDDLMTRPPYPGEERASPPESVIGKTQEKEDGKA